MYAYGKHIGDGMIASYFKSRPRTKDSRSIKKLKVGDKIPAYLKGAGYADM